jgi:AcrR family transcriptional regulator
MFSRSGIRETVLHMNQGTSQQPQGSAPDGRAPLSRERVLRAAISIADKRGISAVTMRAVASALGVEAMSLYNHITNKDDMLDGMIDLVVEEIALPQDAADWREAMSCRAVAAHGAFTRHPWAPALIDSRETSGPARLRYFDWVLGVLVRAGFTLETAGRCFSVLDSYIYGFGRQQSNAFAEEADVEEASAEEMAAAFMEAIPPDQYPYLHDMTLQVMGDGWDEDASFRFGLEIVLDGLAQRLSAGKTG